MRLVLRNRAFLVIDLVGWSMLPLLALAIRLDGAEPVATYAQSLVLFTLVAIATKSLAVWGFGLYRRYWRYASVDELALIIGAVTSATVGAYVLYFFVAGPLVESTPHLPRSVPIIDALLTMLFVGGSRFAQRLQEHLRHRLGAVAHGERILIVGAGVAGSAVARELLKNPQLELDPVGFVDDDGVKLGNTIHGLRVLGTRADIPDIVREWGVSTVVIAMPTAGGSIIREIREQCERAKVPTKTVPGIFEILSGRVSVNQIRDVQIEDLLRRPPVQTDIRAVRELVRGMRVLVTGAGGSIGSEVCRQIAHLGARELMLVGHGENEIFDIEQELRSTDPDLATVPVIVDIRNAQRVMRIFERHQPDAVFHAAAHKHVPLMELNPEEAVTNNVGGTYNILRASEAVGVDHFVLISTDKAVNPANVMGATKLLAERIVHDTAVRTGGCYVSVRFGNVLASRGSVVPVFQQQIKAGGPITVTHPDMTRYFMTIPEAVQLVLQAAAIGKGGETFVLDMGEPVRIVQLATDLVRLSGLEIDRDIRLVYTGLRPGEKMREELFLEHERASRTSHEKVFVVTNGTPESEAGLAGRVEELVAVAREGDILRMRHLLGELVPGFTKGANADLKVVPGTAPRDSGSRGERSAAG